MQTPPPKSPEPSDTKDSTRRGPQFSIGMLLLLTVVACVMATMVSYMYQAFAGSKHDHIVGIVLILAAPTLLLVIVSTLNHLLRRK